MTPPKLNIAQHRADATSKLLNLISDPTTKRLATTHLPNFPIPQQLNFLKAVLGKVSPKRAISLHCLQCMGYDKTQPPLCTAKACPLYHFRI